MATARPPGGTGSTPNARIGFDYSALRAAPNVAREVGRATARELQNAFKIIQGEQKIALAEAQQGVAAVKAQQAQITATTRAESAARVAASRAESVERQQAARRETVAFAEEQRRQTAQFKSELRARQQAARASQVSAGAFGQNLASFAGSAFGGPIGGLAGAFASGSPGLAAGLAISEGARAAVEATQVATAFNRQELAATKLAGTQSRLNALMETFDSATGNAVDDATALANVTNLMAQGFAKNNVQFEEFLRGVRGSSIATGKPQDFIIERAQFEMLNQTGQRLNEIGLGMAEVRQRADELRASNQNLSKEQAYQQAVIQKLNEKYGDLTKSQLGQATGTEKFSTATKNLNLALGQVLGPTVNLIGDQFANYLDIWTARLKLVRMGAEGVAEALQQWGLIPAPPVFGIGSRNSLVGRGGGITLPPERFRGGLMIGSEQQAVINRNFVAGQGIDRDEQRRLGETAREGAIQRIGIENNYQKTVIREQQDFARARANAERKLQLSILDVAQDSARQRSRWEADSERAIAKARQDTAKRITELDKDFQKEQARREKDFSDDMLEAAGRLDAKALLELRKDRARELQDAKEAHKEQRADLQEQLAEREAEERESLQRRIDEQRENDRLRIQEMKANFEAQKAEEDEERRVMLERRAQDHQDQLDEFDCQQTARIQQIKDQAQEQRDALDEQFQLELDAVGIRTKAFEEKLRQREIAATEWFDRVWEHWNKQFNQLLTAPAGGARPTVPGLAVPGSFASGGYVERSGWAQVHRGEFVMPAPVTPMAASGMGGVGRSVSFSGDIIVAGTTDMGRNELRAVLIEVLEEIAEGRG